jgi:uncharacterized caspase-like protein
MLVFLLSCSSFALADKRVALTIGNGAYENAPSLNNPIRDASAVAELFRNSGFKVIETHNVGNLDFKRKLREFADLAHDADIAVVFYAGHAIQLRDKNYMIPVDAKLLREFDAEDETISLGRIEDAVEPAKRLRLVILDACRDNPFLAKMQRRVATRQVVSQGLAKADPILSDTLIAFAAKAGATADDGEGEHSPFTTALLKHIVEPGLDIRFAFGRIRDEVRKSTGGEQDPYFAGVLGGESIPLVPAPAETPVSASEPDTVPELRDYELIHNYEKLQKRLDRVPIRQSPRKRAARARARKRGLRRRKAKRRGSPPARRRQKRMRSFGATCFPWVSNARSSSGAFRPR